MASVKKRRKKINQGEVKNWIMFVFALGLLYGMFQRGDELGPWWTLVIGAMLSLTTLMVAVENIMGIIKRGTSGQDNDRESGNRPTPDDGTERTAGYFTDAQRAVQHKPRDQDTPSSERSRQRGHYSAAEVAYRWYAHLPRFGGFNSGAIQYCQ